MKHDNSPRKKKHDSERSVTPSSGNVFEDLGIDQAGLHLAKAQIVYRISELIGKLKLSQAKAAALLDIDQPKISALLRGSFRGFSTERLLRLLVALDQDIEIRIKPKRRSAKRGELRVLAA